MNEISLIYVTCSSIIEAQKIGIEVLEKSLIACFNVLEAKSGYFWEGGAIESDEAVLLLKTSLRHTEKAKAEIEKLHSYDIPCILSIKLSATEAFSLWVNQQTENV